MKSQVISLPLAENPQNVPLPLVEFATGVANGQHISAADAATAAGMRVMRVGRDTYFLPAEAITVSASEMLSDPNKELLDEATSQALRNANARLERKAELALEEKLSQEKNNDLE